MALPPPVDALVHSFLSACDHEAPGLIEGFYLIGSIALGDFRPRTSDVDFIAITPTPADAPALLALERVHRCIRRRWRRPPLDGFYLTWSDLSRSPVSLKPGLCARAGRFQSRNLCARDPIAWRTLQQQGITVRGPAPAELGIWDDAGQLKSWTVDNLRSYWTPLLDRCSHLMSPHGVATLMARAVAWCALGIPRLHYTTSTGRIISKSGAGRYALERFPLEWHRVVREALRLRRLSRAPSLYTSRLARRRDLLAFSRFVISDAARH